MPQLKSAFMENQSFQLQSGSHNNAPATSNDSSNNKSNFNVCADDADDTGGMNSSSLVEMKKTNSAVKRSIDNAIEAASESLSRSFEDFEYENPNQKAPMSIKNNILPSSSSVLSQDDDMLTTELSRLSQAQRLTRQAIENEIAEAVGVVATVQLIESPSIQSNNKFHDDGDDIKYDRNTGNEYNDYRLSADQNRMRTPQQPSHGQLGEKEENATSIASDNNSEEEKNVASYKQSLSNNQNGENKLPETVQSYSDSISSSGKNEDRVPVPSHRPRQHSGGLVTSILISPRRNDNDEDNIGPPIVTDGEEEDDPPHQLHLQERINSDNQPLSHRGGVQNKLSVTGKNSAEIIITSNDEDYISQQQPPRQHSGGLATSVLVNPKRKDDGEDTIGPIISENISFDLPPPIDAIQTSRYGDQDSPQISTLKSLRTPSRPDAEVAMKQHQQHTNTPGICTELNSNSNNSKRDTGKSRNDTTSSPSSNSKSSTLKIGSQVIVKNLANASHLNGRRGVVEKDIDATSGRYAVKLLDPTTAVTTDIVAIKGCNLDSIDPTDDPSAPSRGDGNNNQEVDATTENSSKIIEYAMGDNVIHAKARQLSVVFNTRRKKDNKSNIDTDNSNNISNSSNRKSKPRNRARQRRSIVLKNGKKQQDNNDNSNECPHNVLEENNKTSRNSSDTSPESSSALIVASSSNVEDIEEERDDKKNCGGLYNFIRKNYTTKKQKKEKKKKGKWFVIDKESINKRNIDNNTIDPTLLIENILQQSWEVKFLKSLDIITATSFIHAYNTDQSSYGSNNKEGDYLVKSMQKYRKKKKLPYGDKKTCKIAINTWYKQCKIAVADAAAVDLKKKSEKEENDSSSSMAVAKVAAAVNNEKTKTEDEGEYSSSMVKSKTNSSEETSKKNDSSQLLLDDILAQSWCVQFLNSLNIRTAEEFVSVCDKNKERQQQRQQLNGIEDYGNNSNEADKDGDDAFLIRAMQKWIKENTSQSVLTDTKACQILLNLWHDRCKDAIDNNNGSIATPSVSKLQSNIDNEQEKEEQETLISSSSVTERNGRNSNQNTTISHDNDPTTLRIHHILQLQQWEIGFLKSLDIVAVSDFVHIYYYDQQQQKLQKHQNSSGDNEEGGGILVNAMQKYQTNHNLPVADTKSCGVKLDDWFQKCKDADDDEKEVAEPNTTDTQRQNKEQEEIPPLLSLRPHQEDQDDEKQNEIIVINNRARQTMKQADNNTDNKKQERKEEESSSSVPVAHWPLLNPRIPPSHQDSMATVITGNTAKDNFERQWS